MKLFRICPSNLKYIELLARASKIALSDEVALAGFYSEIASVNSGIEVASFFLGYWRGSFGDRFEAVATSMLEKDVPSFFSCCKHLFQSDLHLRVILQFMQDKGHRINATAATLFRAQLCDFQGDYPNALLLVNELVSKQPDNVDYILTKARACKVSSRLVFSKHNGDMQEAIAQLQRACRLEPSDRYINSKCTKYLLRGLKVDEARQCISKFIKRDDFEKQMHELVEMQFTWFTLEMGEARMRRGEYTEALACFEQIDKHYQDFVDDQVDFHNYILRKQTLCPYLEYTQSITSSLLEYEDRIFSDKSSVRAAVQGISCLVQLHRLSNASLSTKLASASLTDAPDRASMAVAWASRAEKHASGNCELLVAAFQSYALRNLKYPMLRCYRNLLKADGSHPFLSSAYAQISEFQARIDKPKGEAGSLGSAVYAFEATGKFDASRPYEIPKLYKARRSLSMRLLDASRIYQCEPEIQAFISDQLKA